jgi:hypothetical protein
MGKRIVRLCYRKVIDASSQKVWDKYVFESTYTEFLLQAQFYNREKKYTAFSDILINVANADKLHYLVSAAVIDYLRQLDGKTPDILNNLGKHFLRFKNYQFEIINSDITNKKIHQVAINFFSEPLVWHDTIDNYLLLSSAGQEQQEDGALADLVQLQPFLSIYSLKTEIA